MDRSFTKDFKAQDDKLQDTVSQAALGISEDFKDGLLLIKQVFLTGRDSIDRGMLTDIGKGFAEIEKNCNAIKGRLD